MIEDSEGYFRIRTLTQRIPVAKSTIWQWVKEGKFPAPVKLSEQVTAWPVAAVKQWEADRANTSNGGRA